MTDTATSTTTMIAAPDAATARLRRVIQTDVALCAVSGVALVAGAGALADLADVEGGGPIVAAGAFLLLLAGALTWLSRAPAEALVRLAPWSAEGDFAWAVGSVALAVAMSMSGTGRALLVAQAVVVAGVGAAKLAAHRGARAGIIGVR
jgi:hypothetical protein